MINKKAMPAPVAGYLKAQNAFDVNALVNQFAEDALVIDENNSYHGHQAIRKWNVATNAKYQTQMLPLELTPSTEGCKVKVELSGTFPGSPAVANFSFKIKNGKIAELEII